MKMAANMRAAILAAALAAIPAAVQAQDDARLLAAIRQVESGGNDRAVGDGGRAIGPLQIWRACWTDACEYGRVTWRYETLAWSWPHCQQVARWYWARYGATTAEAKARCWNGGPGWRKNPKATDKYWRHVRAALQK